MIEIGQLQARQREIQMRSATIGGEADMTDELRSELGALRVELVDNLARQNALEMAGQGHPKPELRNANDRQGHEYRQLLNKANLGKMMAGIADDAQGNGAEMELRQALGMPDNYIPLEMLETRAAVAVTGDESNSQLPWIQRVFPNSAAAFCGVDVSTVAVGEQTVPVIGTGVTIGFPGRVTAQAESSPTAAVTTLTPRRGTGNFPIAKEDLLKFPSMEDAWRMELSDAVMNAVDVDLLTLATKGLLAFGTAPTAPTDATTAAEYLADVYGAVDGALASNIDQIRLLVGPETYGHMGGAIYDTGSGMTVVDKLQSIGVGVLVTDNAGAYAGNMQEGLVIVGPPRRNAQGVMWGGVEIIRDEYTLASTGQIKFTVNVMWDFEMLRTTGYTRKRYRNS